MRKTSIWIFGWTLAVLAAGCTSQPARPQVERVHLKNGLPVVLYYLPEVPTVSVGVLFKGGAAKLQQGEDGLEYLAVSAALQGSENLPYPRFREEAYAYGIDLSVQPPRNDFLLVTARAVELYAHKAVRLLADGLMHPEWNPTAFEKVRRQLLARARMKEQNPDERVWLRLNQKFYAGHPYQVRPDGTPETLERFTLDQVRAYLPAHLTASELLIGVTGAFDRDSVLAWLNETFGTLPKGDFVDPEVPAFSRPDSDLVYHETMPIITAYFAAKFPAPSPRDPEFPTGFAAMQVLSQALGDTIRTGYGLSYAVWAGLSLNRANYGYLYFSSTEPDRALELLKKTLHAFQARPITPEEKQHVLNLWQTLTYMRESSSQSLLSSLLTYEYIGPGAEMALDLVRRLEQVSPEEIQAFLKQYPEPFVGYLLLQEQRRP